MKIVVEFVRATMVGGLLFLMPLAVLLIVVEKVHHFISRVIQPLTDHLFPVHSWGGIAVAQILAAGVLILFCFLAGLLARTSIAGCFVNRLESIFLSNLPGYAFVKDVMESLSGIEKMQSLDVVLALVGNSYQIGFVVERLEDGHIAVFIPNAPSVLSGIVRFMSADQIKPLDLPIETALRCLRRLGVGSNEILRGKLQPPSKLAPQIQAD